MIMSRVPRPLYMGFFTPWTTLTKPKFKDKITKKGKPVAAEP